MEDENFEYLNFPLHLLQSIFEDHSQTMDDIMDYAMVSYVLDIYDGGKDDLKKAGKKFGITIGNINRMWQNGNDLREHDNQPFIGIKKDTAFEFYKTNKKEFDIAVLAMHLGIKSILTNGRMVKTNTAHCVARMLGFLTYKDAQHLDLYEKYTRRRQFEKVMQVLERKFGLKKISINNRGFYLSHNLNYEQMAQIILTEKQEYAELQMQKKQAIEKAKERIKQAQNKVKTLNGQPSYSLNKGN